MVLFHCIFMLNDTLLDLYHGASVPPILYGLLLPLMSEWQTTSAGGDDKSSHLESKFHSTTAEIDRGLWWAGILFSYSSQKCLSLYGRCRSPTAFPLLLRPQEELLKLQFNTFFNHWTEQTLHCLIIIWLTERFLFFFTSFTFLYRFI